MAPLYGQQVPSFFSHYLGMESFELSVHLEERGLDGGELEELYYFSSHSELKIIKMSAIVFEKGKRKISLQEKLFQKTDF